MKIESEELGDYSIIKNLKTSEDVRKVHSKAYVMGTSVLAVKFKNGVILASDTQLSYGSYAKYKGVSRLEKITETTLLGSSGEYSNFQELVNTLKIEMTPLPGEEELFGPRECFEMVKNHMYSKRSKGEPEFNTHVIAGIEKTPNKNALKYENDNTDVFLAVVDHLGNFYHAPIVATGIGGHIALPILRGMLENKKDISEQEAFEALTIAMRALIYRDTRASSVVQLAKIEKGNRISISDYKNLDTNWDIGEM